MEARCNQQYSCGQDCCSDVICAVWNELLLEGKEMIAEPKPAQLSVVVDAESGDYQIWFEDLWIVGCGKALDSATSDAIRNLAGLLNAGSASVCGMMSKAQAGRGAKALRRKLKGKGWKIDVWENMGWHYCLTLGPLKVCKNGWHNTHTTLMSATEDCAGGSYLWLVQGSFKDPNGAVRAQINKARQTVDRLNALVKSVEDALK